VTRAVVISWSFPNNKCAAWNEPALALKHLSIRVGAIEKWAAYMPSVMDWAQLTSLRIDEIQMDWGFPYGSVEHLNIINGTFAGVCAGCDNSPICRG
jgi:hypothetical protein